MFYQSLYIRTRETSSKVSVGGGGGGGGGRGGKLFLSVSQ